MVTMEEVKARLVSLFTDLKALSTDPKVMECVTALETVESSLLNATTTFGIIYAAGAAIYAAMSYVSLTEADRDKIESEMHNVMADAGLSSDEIAKVKAHKSPDNQKKCVGITQRGERCRRPRDSTHLMCNTHHPRKKRKTARKSNKKNTKNKSAATE